jgi:23S rRNA pseudouridine2457 synthase
MSRLILFNKPYKVLTQFTDGGGRKTLADFINIKNIYAAGRLDYVSEGLMVLSDNGRVQHLISDPRHKLPKEYLAQVEGIPDESNLDKLRAGVELNDGLTLPAIVKQINPPSIWVRSEPIRERKNIPTSWLSITIKEGRNRQVRRMTANIGYPALRLIRVRIGEWSLGSLQPGEWREETLVEVNKNRFSL